MFSSHLYLGRTRPLELLYMKCWTPQKMALAFIDKLGVSLTMHRCLYVEIKRPTRCNRWFFIAKLIVHSICFGHHYSHHQELKTIIQVVAACGTSCFGLQVVGLVWSCSWWTDFCAIVSLVDYNDIVCWDHPTTGHITSSNTPDRQKPKH